MKRFSARVSVVVPLAAAWVALLGCSSAQDGADLGGVSGAGGAGATTAVATSTTAASSSGSGGSGGGSVSSGVGGGGGGSMAACPEGGTVLRTLPPNSGPCDVVVDETYVYWSSQSTGLLERASKEDGSGLWMLADGLGGPMGLALNGGLLYFADYDEEGVPGRVPVEGGAVEPLLAWPGAYPSRDVTVSETNIYWTTEPDDLWHVQDDLVGAYLLFTANALPTAVVSDTERVYWLTTLDGSVKSSAHGSLVEDTLATGQNIPSALAVDDSYVFWANYGDGAIYRTDKSTGAGTLLLASGPAGPRGIAIDDLYVYWTNFDVGTVSRVPKAGGPSEVLCSGQGAPYGIAVDGAAVYWVDHTNDTVSRLDK